MIRRIFTFGVDKSCVSHVQKRMFCSSASANVLNTSAIERKWQQIWADSVAKATTDQLSSSRSNKGKYYVLSQFPYPSGNLHMGHARVYYISDVIARFERLRGKEVINPMGWDAFGLPAENAAISRNVEPSVWTESNIAQMKDQMHKLGVCFDWDRELSTCNEDYYKWTQWIFIQLVKKGLAYKKEAEVNWDPVDLTVLANEQVDEKGRSWRSGALVEKKMLNQWFIKTTAYGKDLKDDLDGLDGWPNTVQEMQRGWIGYSEGTQVAFRLQTPLGGGVKGSDDKNSSSIDVFTTRVDTICGVTFLAIAYDSTLAQHLVESQGSESEKAEYARMKDIIASRPASVADSPAKIGVSVSNVKAVNPVTGDLVPVYLVDYVLKEYGTGAVMGVPAHDERDFEFAEKYSIPVKSVLEEKVEGSNANSAASVLINSGRYNGLTSKEAIQRITIDLKEKQLAFSTSKTSMRDWLVSRQRYWGVPIPIIHCAKCGVLPVPEEQLPVKLPKKLGNPVSLKNGNPLAQMEEFVKCKCHVCGGNAVRETDTLDTFVDSSWYFLRFADPKNSEKIFESELAGRWMPVDLYIGGMEHAILHLLYARFVHKFLHKEGLIPEHKEPFKQLIVQGLVKSKSYRLKSTGKYLFPEEIAQYRAEDLDTKIEKMSKSKNNGVNPLDEIDKSGADCLRMTLLFSGPNEKDINWDASLQKTLSQFLNRVWALHVKLQQMGEKKQAAVEINEQTRTGMFKKVCGYLENIENALERKDRSFHVAIARQMELLSCLNEFSDSSHLQSREFKVAFESFLSTLYPFAPHMVSEIGDRMSLGTLAWPNVAELKAKYLAGDSKFVAKINGKFKGTMESDVNLIEAADDVVIACVNDSLAANLTSFKRVVKISKKNETIINIVL